jgi:hypothetical protein
LFTINKTQTHDELQLFIMMNIHAILFQSLIHTKQNWDEPISLDQTQDLFPKNRDEAIPIPPLQTKHTDSLLFLADHIYLAKIYIHRER